MFRMKCGRGKASRFGRILALVSMAWACSDEPHGLTDTEGAEAGGEHHHAGTAGHQSLAPGEGGDAGQVARAAGAAAGLRTRALDLRFEARVGDEPFRCGASYVSASGVAFTPADLRFFVQDLSLISVTGDRVPLQIEVRAPWQLEEVALLDFEDGTGACRLGTAAENRTVTVLVPEGEYRGLAFSNGVPESLNHADPASLPPPLQAGSLSWGWLQGYRFLMAEVVMSAPDGGTATPGSAVFHLGSTGCHGNPGAGAIGCDRENRNQVVLSDFEPDTDVVVVDVAALFDGMALDRVTTCHSSGEVCASLFDKVGLRYPEGTSNDGQRVFRAGRVLSPPLDE